MVVEQEVESWGLKMETKMESSSAAKGNPCRLFRSNDLQQKSRSTVQIRLCFIIWYYLNFRNTISLQSSRISLNSLLHYFFIYRILLVYLLPNQGPASPFPFHSYSYLQPLYQTHHHAAPHCLPHLPPAEPKSYSITQQTPLISLPYNTTTPQTLTQPHLPSHTSSAQNPKSSCPGATPALQGPPSQNNPLAHCPDLKVPSLPPPRRINHVISCLCFGCRISAI